MFAFRCIACGEAFHQPLQPYASDDHSLRHKAWLHTWRGITVSRLPDWLAMRAGSLAQRIPMPLVACLSNRLAYKAYAPAFFPCSAITSTAAFGRLLESPESRALHCYQRSYPLSTVSTQPSLHSPRGRTTEVSGFAAAFIPTTKPVLAKAFTVFAFFIFVTSVRNVLNYTICNDPPTNLFLSPFVFEYEVNPVIHRPYLQTSKCRASIGRDRNASAGYPPASGEILGLDVAQNVDAVSSTPSTPLASPNGASTSWLDTPVTSSSTNTSPLPSVVGSFTQRGGSMFTCCHCQEVFYRHCDLK